MRIQNSHSLYCSRNLNLGFARVRRGSTSRIVHENRLEIGSLKTFFASHVNRLGASIDSRCNYKIYRLEDERSWSAKLPALNFYFKEARLPRSLIFPRGRLFSVGGKWNG